MFILQGLRAQFLMLVEILKCDLMRGNTVTAINTSVFRLTDVGAKVIAPTIYNAYITDVDETTEIGNSGTYQSATIKGLGPGLWKSKLQF